MAFRSSSLTVTNGNASTTTVPVPSGAAVDDIAVIFVSIDNPNSQTFTWPTNFTELSKGNISGPDGHSFGCAWKRLTAADSGSYTVSWSNASDYMASAMLFSGRDTGNPPVASTLVQNSTANASPVSVTANGVTAVDGDDLMWIAAPDITTNTQGTSFSPPATFTEQQDVVNVGASGWVNISSATKENVSAGATGSITGTFTANVTAGYFAELVRIPAAGGGGGGATPFNQEDWPVPRGPLYPTSLRTWTSSYNLNLVGKDVFPPGRLGVLYDDPSRGYLPSGKTWTSSYNLNLIAKDAFPPGRRGAFADLSPRSYPPPGKTWTWQYNLNLVAKDALPPGRQRSERPVPVWWYREWTQNLLLSTLSITVQTPFNQYNWPLPQRAPQPDRTQVENLVLTTLLSQDALPPGQQRTEVPPAVSWRRDWTQNLVLSTLLGQDQLPPGQVSNRIIVPDLWRRDWAQNLLLSTLAPVIQAPLNQYDWSVPARPAVSGQTWTLNLLLSTLAPMEALPFNQYDWPVPQRAGQWNRSFASSFNLNLIGQDQLPFRQSDWPLPRGYYYPLSVKDVATLNLNLFPPPVIVPAPVGEFNNPPFIGTSVGQMGSWS